MRPVHFLFLLILILPDAAMAAANLQDASATFSGLLELIRQNANSWSFRLHDYAVRLFWSLALIQLVWTFFPLVMRQADLSEIMAELIRFIMVTGFFAALLMYSVEWGEAIVNSFRQAGATAAGVGVGLRPGDMMGLAVELAKTIADVETAWPLVAISVAVSAVVVLLCFAFIAAFMGLTLIESYVVINASMLFMGFGGSQWTREYAVTMLRYALSVGAKLFVLTLIVGLIMDSARQWQSAYNHDETSTWTMVGLALVCAYLSKTIPELIQALINGVSTGGGSIVGGMAAAGVAGATAAIATMSSAAGASGMFAGGTSSAAKGVSDLVGGGLAGTAANAAPGVMKAAADGIGSAFSGGSPRTGGGSSSGPMPPPPQPSTNKAQKVANVAHKAASATVRSGGILSAISVPGMEGVADLSMGPPPMTPDADTPVEDTPDNVIRPADDKETASIDTSSSISEALNSKRGK